MFLNKNPVALTNCSESQFNSGLLFEQLINLIDIL